jgi:hypothetical protein
MNIGRVSQSDALLYCRVYRGPPAPSGRFQTIFSKGHFRSHVSARDFESITACNEADPSDHGVHRAEGVQVLKLYGILKNTTLKVGGTNYTACLCNFK